MSHQNQDIQLTSAAHDVEVLQSPANAKEAISSIARQLPSSPDIMVFEILPPDAQA